MLLQMECSLWNTTMNSTTLLHHAVAYGTSILSSTSTQCGSCGGPDTSTVIALVVTVILVISLGLSTLELLVTSSMGQLLAIMTIPVILESFDALLNSQVPIALLACTLVQLLVWHHLSRQPAGQDLQTNHDNTSLEWNSDVRTEAASNHWGKHTLRQVTMMSLKKHGLIEECNVPEETMLQFMDRVEKGYHPENPYHNTIHAADVTLTVSGICFRDSCSLALKPHQVLALIVAAAVHDVDHQGRTNGFLAATNSHVATEFDGISIAEQQSNKIFLQELCRNNFLVNLTRKEQQEVKAIVKGAVLFTDMANRASLLTQFAELLAQKVPSASSWTLADTILLCGLVLHAADIGNAAKDWSISAVFGQLCHEEFHSQGDEQRLLLQLQSSWQPQPHEQGDKPAAWLTPLTASKLAFENASFSPRDNFSGPAAQKFFLETFVRGTFEALQPKAPESAKLACEGCSANIAKCAQLIADGCTTLEGNFKAASF